MSKMTNQWPNERAYLESEIERLSCELEPAGFSDYESLKKEVDDYVAQNAKPETTIEGLNLVRLMLIKNGLEEGLRRYTEEGTTAPGFLLAQLSIIRYQKMQRDMGVPVRVRGCGSCLAFIIAAIGIILLIMKSR